MSIDKIILRNEVFAEILQENNLILAKDRIYERAVPFSTWISRNIHGASSRIILDDFGFKKGFIPEEDMHFIHNGEYDSEMDKYIGYTSVCGAFTIGICTDDPKEYEMTKESYIALKEKLAKETGYGKDIKVIETENRGHKAFLLTLRRKNN